MFTSPVSVRLRRLLCNANCTLYYALHFIIAFRAKTGAQAARRTAEASIESLVESSLSNPVEFESSLSSDATRLAAAAAGMDLDRMRALNCHGAFLRSFLSAVPESK